MSFRQVQAERASGERGRLRHRLALFLAAFSGALVATQSRINGELARALDDGYSAAAISTGSGLIILLVVACMWKPGRVGLRRIRSEFGPASTGALRPWMLLGGVAGATFVIAQGLTVAVLGVALFTVAVVAGQTASALILDRIGLGPGGVRALSPSRVADATLAFVAVLLAVSAQLGGSAPLWMLVLPFVVGIATGWQQAVNGRVRAVAQSAFSATLLNFIAAGIVLLGVLAVRYAVVGIPTELPSEWWLYMGGAIGCIFIAIQAALVRVTGVLLLALATVAGQLVAALVIDWATPGQTVDLSTIAGTSLALVAVIVASGWLGSLRKPARAESQSTPI